MRFGTIVVFGVVGAVWLEGLLLQMDSREAAMHYLAVTMFVIAAVVSWKIPHPRRRRFRDRA
jgi:hypothetical protein